MTSVYRAHAVIPYEALHMAAKNLRWRCSADVIARVHGAAAR